MTDLGAEGRRSAPLEPGGHEPAPEVGDAGPSDVVPLGEPDPGVAASIEVEPEPVASPTATEPVAPPDPAADVQPETVALPEPAADAEPEPVVLPEPAETDPAADAEPEPVVLPEPAETDPAADAEPEPVALIGLAAGIGPVEAPPRPDGTASGIGEAVARRWAGWSGPEGPGAPSGGAGAVGALAPLATWAAVVTGDPSPAPFRRIRHVVFAAGAHSDGTDPARELLAANAGATLRTVPVPGGDTDAAIQAAVALGVQVADEEADSGTDLVIPAVLSASAAVPAVVLIAALTGSEPVRALGFDPYTPDEVWIERCTAVRDTLHRVTRATSAPAGAAADPLASLASLGQSPLNADPLITAVGAADLAAVAGFLARSAARRTPALLDGLGVGAAALVARDWAPEAPTWWLAVNGPGTAGEQLAYGALGLTPATSTATRLGDGTGALLALPLLAAALALLGLTPAAAPDPPDTAADLTADLTADPAAPDHRAAAEDPGADA